MPHIALGAKTGELNNAWYLHTRFLHESLRTIWIWPGFQTTHPLPPPGTLWLVDASLKASTLREKHLKVGYLPKGVENLCPHKNLHKDVYRSFILNYQNLEATKLSFNRWMDKLWCIQTMEYYSELKGNELSSHEKTWRNFKCLLLSERSQSEKAVYCMIPTIWHSGKTMETVKRSVDARG